jgi:hypothetical protein
VLPVYEITQSQQSQLSQHPLQSHPIRSFLFTPPFAFCVNPPATPPSLFITSGATPPLIAFTGAAGIGSTAGKALFSVGIVGMAIVSNGRKNNRKYDFFIED